MIHQARLWGLGWGDAPQLKFMINVFLKKNFLVGGGKEVGLCSFLGKFGVLRHTLLPRFWERVSQGLQDLFEILVCFHGDPICCSFGLC